MVFILPSLKIGGAEKAIVEILKQLDPEKFERHLILIHSWEDGDIPIPHEIKVHFLHHRRLSSAYFSIWTICKRLKPNVIVSSLTHLNIVMCSMKWALPSRTRLIIREASHLHENVKNEKHPHLMFQLAKFFYHKSDSIVCLSKAMADDLKARTKLTPNQLITIPNGVRRSHKQSNPFEESCHSKKTHLNIIVVGRLVPNKSPHYILSSFRKWNHSNKHIKLYFLGEGSEKESLKKKVHHWKLDKYVHLIGQVSDPTPYYQHADLLLFASEREGLSNVLLEASSTGCPIIVKQHPGGSFQLMQALKLERYWGIDFEELSFPNHYAPTWKQETILRSKFNEAKDLCHQQFGMDHVISLWEELLSRDLHKSDEGVVP